MMTLVRNGQFVEDIYTDARDLEPVPVDRPVIVSLAQWQHNRDALLAGGQPLGIRLQSDQPPALVASELQHFAVVALEFPKFRDGRAYTHARMLRERHAFAGELRAVGDVLQEQLNYMQRCGFDAFEISAADPLAAWQAIENDHTVWYQATGDGRPRALELRQRT
ncbi:MAG: DUF934 domain-containing protein [Gammaproteobacteria bacterium]|nr:DUF934 domain-containing protein [Gammaproteobacteria bacterium]MCP5140012.1 DUF934 domain-containing protein [Chromatiales bacterium]